MGRNGRKERHWKVNQVKVIQVSNVLEKPIETGLSRPGFKDDRGEEIEQSLLKGKWRRVIVSVIFSYKSRKLILRNRRLVAKYFQLFAGLGSAVSISCWRKQKK